MKVIKPKTVSSAGSFTRASTGTFHGSNGLLQTAAINALRYQYNPVTLAFRGLLIEVAATNLMLQSETFDNASWTKTNSTATANTLASPTGVVNAETITASAINGSVKQSFTSVSATVYTWSCYAKAGTSSVVNFSCQATAAVFVAQFNLSTGVASTVSGTGTTTVTALSNGWYRCTATATSTGAGTGFFEIIIPTSGLTVYLYGSQLETGSTATSYIATTTATVTRSADVISGADTGFIYSSAVEAYSAWSSGTTYAKDAFVIYQTHIYKSLVNTNTNNIPSVVGSTFWIDMGADNAHAMFDGQISSKTTGTSPLQVTVSTGIINSVALLGLVGTTANVYLTDGATLNTIYSTTIGLDGTILADWYMYFFEPFVQKSDVVLTNVPPYSSGYLTFIMTGTSSLAIGELMIGTVYSLGVNELEQGVTLGIIDYSRKDTNTTTGVTTFVQGAFSKRMSGQFLIDNGQLNTVQSVLASVRASPSIYLGSEQADYSPLIVYGFYRDFSIDIAYPTKSFCRIEVEGLI